MFQITPLDRSDAAVIQQRIDNKTKPPGALGQLEALAERMALIQGTDRIGVAKPHMLVFAADHGITEEGVSPFPSEVTGQMVMNFVAGGAAINCFCREFGIEIEVIDAGVKSPLPEHALITRQHLGAGTANFCQGPAMTHEQVVQALSYGASRVADCHSRGCNVVGLGEMGIGNTSAAAALMAAFTGLSADACVGKGTGLDDAGVRHKIDVIARALALHRQAFDDPMATLAAVGGFEIAQMAGAMLKAAELKMLVLVDGFIASAAAMAAVAIDPACKDYLVFSHASNEQGHQRMLRYLDVEPLLNLDLRLGEGSGAALALPLLRAACAFYNDMASFESAGVSQA